MTRIDPGDVEHIPAEAASTYAKLATAYGGEYYASVASELAGHLEAVVRLLDAGTGPGELPIALARHCEDVRIEGFDVTPELLRSGRERAAEQGVLDRVSFFAADCYAIPVPRDSYEALTCTGVLHGLDRPVDALAEFRRVLAPGGSAWVFDPAVLDVPPDPDIDLTQHEREILESYDGLAWEKVPSVAEARRLVESSPFESYRVEAGERGDVRLYLG